MIKVSYVNIVIINTILLPTNVNKFKHKFVYKLNIINPAIYVIVDIN